MEMVPRLHFSGASLLYFSDGNSNFYSYNFATSTLTVVQHHYNSLNGVHSLTPLSVSGGSGTPTPTPDRNADAHPNRDPDRQPRPRLQNNLYYADRRYDRDGPRNDAFGIPGVRTRIYLQLQRESSLFAAGATIDPNGTLGIYRYYQTTTNGTSYLPLTATAANPASTVWAWPSGSTNTHAAISYMAGQIDTTAGTRFLLWKGNPNARLHQPGEWHYQGSRHENYLSIPLELQ